jgi:hypothetical protein
MDIQPRYTKVEKMIQIKLGVIVLEHPSGFPLNDCNLYCITASEKIVWKAEKPEANTLFSRVRANEDGDTLSAYTVGGHACELELKTGKLISHTSIK